MKYHNITEGFADVSDVMGGDDHMCFVSQRCDELEERSSLLRVESYGGFVQEQDLGAVDDGLSDCDTLLLPAGQFADLPVRLPSKAHTFQCLAGRARRVALRHTLEPPGVGDVLAAGHPREERRLLREPRH